MITYAIDGATGQLRRSATQRVGGASQWTGEPRGRYVFASYDARQLGQEASIVAYAPDPSSGSLVALSEASDAGPPTIWQDFYWPWLSASSTRVYGILVDYAGHFYASVVSHAVESEGQLGPASWQGFDRDDVPWVALGADSEPDVFYRSTSTGGLTAHFVAPDGRLTRMGGSHLCLASSMLYAQPLVAARGFLFASVVLPASPSGSSGETVCSWEGPRLAPRTNLGMLAHRAIAYVPRLDATFSWRASATPMVAMTGDRWDLQHEVRLFAIGADGGLVPLDMATGPSGVKDLLFHPSGRFLYVSYVAYYEDSPIGLDVYSIDPQGRLEPVQTLEDGGGAMAETVPQARASGTIPTPQDHPGE